MNITTILIISFLAFLGLLITALVFFGAILWWNKRTENRLDLIWALIDDGNQIKSVRGKQTGITKNAIMYHLENNMLIVVPNNYGVKYIKHRRKIDLLSSGALVYSSKNTMTQLEYEIVIKDLLFSKIGADMIHAVSGSTANLMTIIIIGAITLGVGIFGGMAWQRQSQPQPQPIAISQPVTENMTENITMEIK